MDPGATKGKRVLLVEGDGFTRLVLLLRLRLAGFAVDFTSNGILGLGKLRSCRPDILLVELKLCGLSGLDLIKAARAEPSFGNRPIYVFTHVDRMGRTARKEVKQLATKVLDKGSLTREDLVNNFAKTFLNREVAAKNQPDSAVPQPPAQAISEPPSDTLNEMVTSEALEEIIAGVREQTDLLASQTGDSVTNGAELVSRVRSLASCAEAAGLANLRRQAKALENFLNQLFSKKQGYTGDALSTVTRAADVMSLMPLATNGKRQALSRFSAVLVDEAPGSNQAMKEALLHAGLEPVCFEEPARAREYLASNRTEVIIANISLPEAHSLALADIRKLPLHEETPVIFGRESTLIASSKGPLPTSAPRLDLEPLLSTELVVRALNEVQSPQTAESESEASAAPRGIPQPFTKANPDATSTFEDGFALFGQTQRNQEVSAFQSAQSASESAEAIHQPFRWPAQSVAQDNAFEESLAESTTAAPEESEHSENHLFTSEDIPGEIFLKAEPGTTDVDSEAEILARLPAATPIDGTQLDEQAVETLPPSDFTAESELPPQPEPMTEDHTASAWLAESASEVDQTAPTSNAPTELEQNEIDASTSAYEEVMNHELQTDPAEYAQPGEVQSDHANQQENLAERVCAAEMALFRAQAELEQRDKAIEALQEHLAEATGDRSLAPGEAVVEQSAKARCAELEEEVASLRQALEDFNGSFGQQQNAAAEADKQVQELEERLRQSKSDLEKQREQQRDAEADWRKQLEETKAASQQSQAAHHQAEDRCGQLEKELDGLRQTGQALADKLAQEQKAGAESAARLKQLQAQVSAGEPGSSAEICELEQQVRQGVAALARATADLAREKGERQRSQQRTAELNARLQSLHEDFSRTLQAQRENLERIGALEDEQRQTGQELDRRTADLEELQAEHRLTEEQLQKEKELSAQLRNDLSFFEEANKKFGGSRQELQSRLEANLTAARENEAKLQQEVAERQRVSENLEAAQRELQNQARRRETLEQELQTTREALQELEAKLQKEAAERQRLNEAQNSARRNLWDGSERDLELSKLQSALELEQVERKRQESELARMRQSGQDAAHAARALRATLRRQIREPVDNLVHSTRTLLEFEMGEEQKKLTETVLQDVLLVQTRLGEPEVTHGDAAEPTASPT
jgi:CheY-like chemotaxis protein